MVQITGGKCMLKRNQPKGSSNLLGPIRLAVVFLLVPLLFSCAQEFETTLPGIAADEKGVYQPGRFIWFELLTEDGKTARRFYSQLFGWTFAESAQYKGYSTIVHNGREIGGILDVAGEDLGTLESRWICSISTSNVDEAAKNVASLGGTLLNGPVDSGSRGRLAQVEDSQGADFILLRSPNGDPGKFDPVPGNPIWVDLFTPNKSASLKFYTNLYDYDVTQPDENAEHYVFTTNSKSRAGLTPVLWDDLEATWLLFIGVANLRVNVMKAIDLGATLITYNERAAVILDPSGAAIGLHLLAQGGQK